MHGRLLGPCFKTGRMETDLLGPPLGATLRSARTDTAQAAAFVRHEDAKERPSDSERRTRASNQQNSVQRNFTDRHTRQRYNRQAITPHTRERAATFLPVHTTTAPVTRSDVALAPTLQNAPQSTPKECTPATRDGPDNAHKLAPIMAELSVGCTSWFHPFAC